jgi:hypothetical protein
MAELGSAPKICLGGCGSIGQVDTRSSLLAVLMLVGCQDLVPCDTIEPVYTQVRRSEISALWDGFGTTFAVVRDLAAMLKRRSNAVMNPGMATIMGAYDARPTQPLYDRVVLTSR